MTKLWQDGMWDRSEYRPFKINNFSDIALNLRWYIFTYLNHKKEDGFWEATFKYKEQSLFANVVTSNRSASG